MPPFSFSDIVGLFGIVFAVVLVVLDKSGKLRGRWLFVLLGVAAVMTLFIAIGNAWVLDAPHEWKFWRGALMICLVALVFGGIGIWINPYHSATKKSAAVSVPQKSPSLIFIIGVPLGDNASPTWMMLLRHFGPEPAHNCTVAFYDKDRKNLEHLWLVNHGSPPFLPEGQFEMSHQIIHIPEANPEGPIPGSFQWSPLDPDRQHYEVSISCRDGAFVEKWEVTRVDGVLRSRILIEHGPAWVRKNQDLDPILFKCQDPEFVTVPLAPERPNKTKKEVHSGWKPNYKVEIPMAIIDPNGNLQIASAVSGHSDFGCWNLLTKHIGDEPTSQP